MCLSHVGISVLVRQSVEVSFIYSSLFTIMLEIKNNKNNNSEIY